MKKNPKKVKICLHITICHRCKPGITVIYFKIHKWWSYHSFTERSFKMSKISIMKFETSGGFEKCIQAFVLYEMTALHPITISKYSTLKPNLWRSMMQRWTYLWHLNSCLWFIRSKENVSLSIEMQIFDIVNRHVDVRSGLSLIIRRSGGMVHGFSPW